MSRLGIHTGGDSGMFVLKSSISDAGFGAAANHMQEAFTKDLRLLAAVRRGDAELAALAGFDPVIALPHLQGTIDDRACGQGAWENRFGEIRLVPCGQDPAEVGVVIAADARSIELHCPAAGLVVVFPIVAVDDGDRRRLTFRPAPAAVPASHPFLVFVEPVPAWPLQGALAGFAAANPFQPGHVGFAFRTLKDALQARPQLVATGHRVGFPKRQ